MKKLFKIFQQPNPMDVAVQQLRFSELQLLDAYGAREAASGHVNVLEARVRRLKQMLTAGESNQT